MHLKQTIAIAVGACAVALVATVGLSNSIRLRPTPQDVFETSAAKLAITDEVRGHLRESLAKSLLESDGDICDEDLRQRAGRAAVAYYETLLEKPFVISKLFMVRRGVCAVSADDLRDRADPLTIAYQFRNGLRLPWDCMPMSWRTPTDLALQARLEGALRSRRLDSESLSGTLAVLALPWQGSPEQRRCHAKSAASIPRRTLPLTSGHILHSGD